MNLNFCNLPDPQRENAKRIETVQNTTMLSRMQEIIIPTFAFFGHYITSFTWTSFLYKKS